jgi:hypothetical protein
MAEADGDRAPRENDLRQLERQFEETLDRVRVAYTASASLEVSRFYSSRVLQSMKYFGRTEDPLFRQLNSALGRLPRGGVKREHAVQFRTYNGPAAATVGSLRRDKMSEREPDVARPEEFPAPSEELLAQSNHLDGRVKIPNSHRGHWILRDEEIATTKTLRKEDAW